MKELILFGGLAKAQIQNQIEIGVEKILGYATPSICLENYFCFINSVNRKDEWLNLSSESETSCISAYNLSQTIIQKYADEFFDGISSFTNPTDIVTLKHIIIKFQATFLKDGKEKKIKKVYLIQSNVNDFELTRLDVINYLNLKNYKIIKLQVEMETEFSLSYYFTFDSDNPTEYSQYSFTYLLNKLMVKRSYEIWRQLSRIQLERGLALRSNSIMAKSISGQLGGLNNSVLELKNEKYSVRNDKEVRNYIRPLLPQSAIDEAKKRAIKFKNEGFFL